MGGGNQESTQNKTDDVGGEGEEISCGTVMVVDHLDLQGLPEGCIANVVSLTTPQDACRLSSVSRSFRSASESDAVWDLFLPPEIHTILSSSRFVQSQHASPSSSRSSKSKKELYLALCDNPIIIEQGKMSFSLDKCSGKSCYMISARELYIVWSDTPHYWKWISVPDSRFEEVAELVRVCWLEIRGKIETRKLSPSTLYIAYLVFKLTAGGYGFQHCPAEAAVGMVGGQELTKRSVFLDTERGQNLNLGYQTGAGRRPRPRRRIINRRNVVGLQPFQPREVNEARYPKERNDGWLEIALGEFFYKGGGDGELEMTCSEVKGGQWKGGLIVQGIEIRPNRKK